MKIDYVIISSDDNKLYYDFYPIVSKQWNNLGFEVFFIHITDRETDIEETEFGLIKKIKAVDGINSGFQAQNARIYSSVLLNNKNMLISDIDMLPLNRDYFIDKADKIEDDKILIYSGQPYGNVPYYPMCYILGNSKLIKNELDIECDYIKYIDLMKKYSKMDWNTDEKYFYDKMINSPNKVVFNRKFGLDSKRIDRGYWKYDIDLLKSNYYIDSHLLRPYEKYKNEINKILL